MEINKEVLVSIIIATYNAEEYLHECLTAIEQQNNPGIEVIIVDGGSSDGTPEIVRSFKGLSIHWRSEKDKGIYDALNKGVEMASAKWIYFLGADDRLLPGFSQLVSLLKDENTVYYGNSQPWYSNDEEKSSYGLLQGEFSAYRLSKYCMNHQSIIYPARAFKGRKYDLKYKVLADYAFNLRLWGDDNFVKKYYAIDLVRYHMNGFSEVETYNDAAFESDKGKLIYQGMGLAVYLRYQFRRLKDKWRG